MFRLKVAEDTYNNEARIKVSIRDTEPIDYTDESAVRIPFVHVKGYLLLTGSRKAAQLAVPSQ